MSSKDNADPELSFLRAENARLKSRLAADDPLHRIQAMQSERDLKWARREAAFGPATGHWLPPLFVLFPVTIGMVVGAAIVLGGS